MSLFETDNWESEKVYRTDSGDMVRSKQERFVANLLTSEGVSFEYERELSSWDGSSRYPDFTLFIKGELYYWEHWGMVDDYSYRQYIARKIRWYREHGYYDYLIQTWGGGDRDLRGQVLAELHRLRKPKRRKIGYKPVSDSHADRKTGHETGYRPEEEGPVGFISQDSGQNTRGWVIPLAIILTLFILGAFFSSIQVPAPVTKSEALKAVSQKPEPEKELETAKKPGSITQEIQTWEPIREKKQKEEMFYMGIKISQ